MNKNKINENIRLKFTDNKSDEFIAEFWEQISKYNLFSMTKNDIVDYIFNLLDRHCELNIGDNKQKRFFTTLPAHRLERYCGINANKIKASQKNIALKYYDDNEYKEIFKNFITNIKPNNFKIEKDKLSFIIENPSIKTAIETELKTFGTTLEYTLNSEKVLLDIDAVITLLKASGIKGTTIEEKLKEYGLLDEKSKLDDGISVKSICKYLLENTKDIAMDLTKDEIKEKLNIYLKPMILSFLSSFWV